MEKRPESRKRERQRKSSAGRSGKLVENYRALEAFDRSFLRCDTEYLVGVDEVGRGALAGPVLAAAVVLPRDPGLVGVNDSKMLTESERESLYSQIMEKAVSVGVASSTPRRIDRDNILNATLFAMAKAVEKLGITPNVVLVDGRERILLPTRVIAIPGGDRKSIAIAAASIIAKVTRDRMMRRLHRRYPVYNFQKNKGYGTREHLEAISRHGVISEHRRTFRLKGIEKSGWML